MVGLCGNPALLENVMRYTNQKQIRALFWESFPTLPKRRHRYGWSKSDKTAELVYPVDTRCAFVDFIDELQRSGYISESLANRATL
jgi:hypothetical protein